MHSARVAPRVGARVARTEVVRHGAYNLGNLSTYETWVPGEPVDLNTWVAAKKAHAHIDTLRTARLGGRSCG